MNPSLGVRALGRCRKLLDLVSQHTRLSLLGAALMEGVVQKSGEEPMSPSQWLRYA
jgi:hypothetical protein